MTVTVAIVVVVAVVVVLTVLVGVGRLKQLQADEIKLHAKPPTGAPAHPFARSSRFLFLAAGGQELL